MFPSLLSMLLAVCTIQHGTGGGIIPLFSNNFSQPQNPVESGTFENARMFRTMNRIIL
jgi:hypothetical protein